MSKTYKKNLKNSNYLPLDDGCHANEVRVQKVDRFQLHAHFELVAGVRGGRGPLALEQLGRGRDRVTAVQVLCVGFNFNLYETGVNNIVEKNYAYILIICISCCV